MQCLPLWYLGSQDFTVGLSLLSSLEMLRCYIVRVISLSEI